jgi:ATP-dependent Zn protease
MDMTQHNNKPVVVSMDTRNLKRESDTNLPSFSKAKLEKLIEEAVVDAYTEEEQVVDSSR